MSVCDFQQTVDWYRRVFGFEVVESGYEGDQPWGVIRAGDAMLCIYQHPERAARTKAALEATAIQFISHFGLRISDRAAWEATVEREGVEVQYGGAFRWPHSTAWYVSDPNGYTIEVAYWDKDQISFESAKADVA
jgi:catechol 2,3-dioxygenase-like lactoylglutathione lyase family enzyme